MKIREFIKYGACGLTLIALGCKKDSSSRNRGGGGGGSSPGKDATLVTAAAATVNFSMEEALVEMVDTIRRKKFGRRGRAAASGPVSSIRMPRLRILYHPALAY